MIEDVRGWDTGQASGPEPSTALSRGPPPRVQRLAWRLLRHLDGHESGDPRFAPGEKESEEEDERTHARGEQLG